MVDEVAFGQGAGAVVGHPQLHARGRDVEADLDGLGVQGVPRVGQHAQEQAVDEDLGVARQRNPVSLVHAVVSPDDEPKCWSRAPIMAPSPCRPHRDP